MSEPNRRRFLMLAAATVGAASVVVTVGGKASAPFSWTYQAPAPPPPLGGLLQVGLYSWGEIQNQTLQTLAKTMDAPVWRIGINGGMDDPTFAAALNLGVQVMEIIYPTTDLDSNGDPTVAGVEALIDAQLTRYGAGGTYWHDNPDAPNIPLEAIEILNEPNWYLYGSEQQKAETYASILVPVYAYVKAKWPTVTVVGGSVSDASDGASVFLPLLYAANPQVFTSFDVFSYHPYTGGDVPLAYYPPDQTILESWGSWQVWTQLASMRSTLTGYGTASDMPIWITEVGYPIPGPDQGGTGTFNTSDSATVTVTEQAAYNIRFDIFCARQGIAQIHHMYVDDEDGFNGGYFDWDATENAYVARPVATATQHEVALLAGATSLTVVAENYGGGNPFIYSFAAPGGTVQVAWAQTPQTTSIAVPGPTTVTDMLGNTLATSVTGSYAAALSENPIWLKST
jgi:hypothetical protein